LKGVGGGCLRYEGGLGGAGEGVGCWTGWEMGPGS
jgi:hypothetical protein